MAYISPKIDENQLNAITLITAKCSPTRFFDSRPRIFAKHCVFTTKYIRQNLMTEMEPYATELGFASPQDTTERAFLNAISSKAVIKS
jgi:hypothetical protein